MPRLSTEERNRAIGHLEAGVGANAVARLFNVNITTVYRLRQRLQVTGAVVDQPRSGRPRATTVRQDRHIVRRHLQNRFQTARDTALHLPGHPQRVSTNTVRRRLIERGLHNQRPARGPILMPRHRQARLDWAQNRLHWRFRDWSRILFSDEKRFCIDHADGRIRVWRRRGERFAGNCVVQSNPWGGPSVMIWGGMVGRELVGPVIFQNVGPGRGNGVNAQRYIAQVLVPQVTPFFRRHPNCVFQQDNARAHIARATQLYLNQNNIAVLPWPAVSPEIP